MKELVHVEPGQWVVYEASIPFASRSARADRIAAHDVLMDHPDYVWLGVNRLRIIATAADEPSALQLIQSLDGCRGEYDARVRSAKQAHDKAIARVIARAGGSCNG